MNRPMIRNQKGFTLFEVLIAITITALLLTTIYGVFSAVSNAKTRVETVGEGYHQARVIFDRVGREIRGVYYNAAKKGSRLSGGINADGQPFLELTTTATTPQSGRRGGISVLEYELIIDPDNDGQQVLMRTEQPLFQAATTTITPDGGYRLASGIETMKWRFFKDGEWHEQWDTGTQKALPQIVELALMVRIEDVVVPFLSSFEISDK
jgi:general secretion pathway protein J